MQRLKVIWIGDCAEFSDVECAVGIKFHAQHFQHSLLAYDCFEEFGVLCHDSANKQAAIAAATNGQTVRIGIPGIN